MGSEYVSEYVDIGRDRIESLKEGTLITRPIYKEIYLSALNLNTERR